MSEAELLWGHCWCFLSLRLFVVVIVIVVATLSLLRRRRRHRCCRCGERCCCCCCHSHHRRRSHCWCRCFFVVLVSRCWWCFAMSGCQSANSSSDGIQLVEHRHHVHLKFPGFWLRILFFSLWSRLVRTSSVSFAFAGKTHLRPLLRPHGQHDSGFL